MDVPSRKGLLTNVALCPNHQYTVEWEWTVLTWSRQLRWLGTWPWSLKWLGSGPSMTFFSFLLWLAMIFPEPIVEGSQDGWDKSEACHRISFCHVFMHFRQTQEQIDTFWSAHLGAIDIIQGLSPVDLGMMFKMVVPLWTHWHRHWTTCRLMQPYKDCTTCLRELPRPDAKLKEMVNRTLLWQVKDRPRLKLKSRNWRKLVSFIGAIFFQNILLLETISRAITGVSLTLLAANDPMNSPPIHRAPWQVMSWNGTYCKGT